ATSGKSHSKSNPKNERSLITVSTVPLVFQTGTFTHFVFYMAPKSLQHLQTALHTSLPLSSPIAIENHEFSASPAYSSVNDLHKISLTNISPTPQGILKLHLLLTFIRLGIVKDFVIYNDDITEIPRELEASFEPLTHRIQLNGSDTSVLATWVRMHNFCRYCKAMSHIKDNCDKRLADSRTCFICHQKEHISYQCTRSQDLIPKIKKGFKAISPLDLTFGPTAMPPDLKHTSY
ncbi:hypothetical protein CU098_013746, partial [Rhizopus stolonifer]